MGNITEYPTVYMIKSQPLKNKLRRKIMHEEITLTTPALLFSAISPIMLAYTNRFLGYATLIRTLQEKLKSNPNDVLLTIRNECDIYS